ncbi:MAG: sel1 repeat family protein, partial [Burkholderiales bacterium]|nr:sel1 repeat family protein [Burkholderiales bacterium]
MKILSFVISFLLASTCCAGEIENLQTKCQQNDGKACVNLGFKFQTGNGVKESLQKAVEYYVKGCKLKSGQGCLNLGIMYANGRDVEQSYPKAVEYFTKSCELKSGQGCLNLGTMYLTGQGVQQNYSKGINYFTKSCDLNFGAGCFNLGVVFAKGLGVDKSYPKAAEYFNKGCELKDGQACANLAGLYATGNGVEQSNPKAVEYFVKGCDLNAIEACLVIGNTLFSEKDLKPKAIQVNAFIKACELGSGEGCDKAGQCFTVPYNGKVGINGSNQPEKAVEYFKRSCELKYLEGCVHFAENRASTLTNKERITYLSKACDAGIAEGCYVLGADYKDDDFPPEWVEEESNTIAFEYFEKVCSLGSKGACAELGNMYFEGDPTLSYSKAAEYYEKACAEVRCPPDDLEKISKMFLNGKNLEQSKEKADLFLSLALRNYGEDCRWGPNVGLGGEIDSLVYSCKDAEKLYKAGIVPKGPAAPLDEILSREKSALQEACNRGMSEFCPELANFYEVGKGGIKSPAMAIKLYVKSRKLFQQNCTGKDEWEARYCLALGRLFAEGKGGAKSAKQAQKYFDLGEKGASKLCNEDNGFYCEELADYYTTSKSGKSE